MSNKNAMSRPVPLYSRIGMALGPALALLIYMLPTPDGLGTAGWNCLVVAALMAVWWATEAIPVAATALLPLILFPLFHVIPIGDTASAYGDPLIFLFMGGFMMALTIQKTGLHRRIALNIIIRAGSRPGAIIIGFMLATALLSMGVSNSATALMMLPIATSIASLLIPEDSGPETRNFATALMLGIAYSASIGGLGTLIGTPPNALLAAYMAKEGGHEISFALWLLVGLPAVAILLPMVWFILTRISFPFTLPESARAGDIVARQLAGLGPMKRSEKRIAIIFTIVAVTWIVRPLLTSLPLLSGLTDTSIAIAGGLSTFLLPHGDEPGPLMRWSDMHDLPWGILLLFGGGLSLAAAVADSGLAAWLGSYLSFGLGSSPILMIGLVTAVIIFLTELTSNTGTAATFLPIVGAIALQGGASAAQLAIPATLAASCAFMLPVATPPNAIVFSSGYVTIPQMVKAGLLANLGGLVVLVLLGRFLLPLLGL